MRPRRSRQALKALRAALDGLGQANDHVVARATLAARAAADPGDPGLAFALGWLTGREDAVLAAAARALAPLDEVRRFWR